MKFSVIVPMYNSQKTIAFTLNSILEQKVVPGYDFELIIINDGSTDNSLKICENFLPFYKNIRIYSQENQGVCIARNNGLAKANGDIVLFVDADDLLPKNALWSYFLAFHNFDIDFAAGLMGSFNPINNSKSISLNYLQKNRGLFRDKKFLIEIFSNAISSCAKAYKREFLLQNNIHFLPHHQFCEDHLFVLTCIKHCKNVFLLDNVVLFYRKNPSSATFNFKNNHLQDMIAVQKEIAKLELKDLSSYYERFLKNHDYKRYIIEQYILGQNKTLVKQGVPLLRELLELIPHHYQEQFINKKFMFKNLNEESMYKAMLLMRLKRKLKITYKSFILNPCKNLCKKTFFLINEKLYKFITKGKNTKTLQMYYKFFSLFPVDKNKVVFGTNVYGMKFLQSIKDEFEKYPHLKLVIAPQKTKSFVGDVVMMWRLASARVILIADYHFPLFGIQTRKQSVVLQCWHAGGLFKKFGFDMAGNDEEELKLCEGYFSSFSYTFVSGKKAISGYQSAFNMKENQIMLLGNIASDTLINNVIPQKEAKILLGVDPNKKLIVYAPTFRDEEKPNFISHLNIEKLALHFNDKYEFALRIHPTLKANIDERYVYNLSKKDENLVLNAADALISDYSSIIFSFALFKRPMYFYPYDYPLYIANRGFYEDYFDFVPGEVALNEEQLKNMLEDIPDFSAKAEKLWGDYMDQCDGKSTQRFVSLVKEKFLS